MKYSREEIQQYIVEEEVKFIRMAFCDIYGKQKNISIMADEFGRAYEHGIAIDASAVPGFGDVVHSDLLLFPDTSTLTALPWRPEHGRVVRMLCAVKHPDGTPCAADCRSLLQRAAADAAQEGITFAFGSEMEFYLFRRDENGEPTRIPYDNAGYMDIAPEDKGENVRREICLTLEQMGIQPERSHHEEGPGQNEIDFRYADPVTAADNAVTFRTVVHTIAARNGLCADFSPKPLAHAPGNGMHVNFSVHAVDGRDVMPEVIAGILAHITEMTAFLNATEESYHRFGVGKYLLVAREPLAAHPDPGGGRRISPRGAALTGSDVQPLSGVYAADPGGTGRYPDACAAAGGDGSGSVSRAGGRPRALQGAAAVAGTGAGGRGAEPLH